MKKFLKKITYRSPEIAISLGAMVIYLAASSSDFGIMYGSGEPEWICGAVLGGFVVIGIGAFLGRVREAANRSKR